jgi:hypothetical protein
LAELDVAGHIVTCDAMHCQKNHPSLRLPIPTKPPGYYGIMPPGDS